MLIVTVQEPEPMKARALLWVGFYWWFNFAFAWGPVSGARARL